MAASAVAGHYHFAGQIFRRSDGDSSVGAAAYRLRTSLTDERTGQKHDYTPIAKDFVFGGVFVDAKAPAWARDAEKLLNRLEQVEKRKDAQLCHEINIGLPSDLTAEQQRYALQDWAKELTRKGYAVILAIHKAHDWGDQRNDHAHVMIPLRKLDIGGNDFSTKKDRYTMAELGDQMTTWRERWAHHANRHLERTGSEIRIDHRSLADQGIGREATVHLGKEAAALERRGIATERGDHNRKVFDHEAERQRITCEIEDLERIHALQQEMAPLHVDPATEQEIEEINEVLARAELADTRQAKDKITQLYPASAVDRLRAEERQEEDRYRRSHPAWLSGEDRGLVAAIWKLSITAAATLRNILVNWERPRPAAAAPPIDQIQDHEQPERPVITRSPDTPRPADRLLPNRPPAFDPKHAREEVTPAKAGQGRADGQEQNRQDMAGRVVTPVPSEAPQRASVEVEKPAPAPKPAETLKKQIPRQGYGRRRDRDDRKPRG